MRSYLLFMLLSSILVGQTNAQQRYTYMHYNQDNGLPQNSINDLYWDKNDFLWLSTEEGLVRFDGNSFYSFNVSNTPIIKRDRFRWILADVNNTILTSTADGNIFLIRNDGIHPSPFKADGYRFFRGTLPTNNLLTELLTIPNQRTEKLGWKTFPVQIVSAQNTSYALGVKNLFSINNDNDSIPLPEKIYTVFSINKHAYARGKNTLYYIDLIAKKLIPLSVKIPQTKDDKIHLFQQQLSSDVFLSIDKKIYVLSATDNPLLLTLNFKIDVSKIVVGEITAINQDHLKQSLAIGSQTNGLYVFKPKIFTTRAHTNNQIAYNGYYAHVSVNDSTILNSYGDELSINTSRTSAYNLSRINTRVIFRDKNNAIWSSRTDTLLYQFAGKPRHAISIPTRERVNSIIQYGDSLLVLGWQKIFFIYQYRIVGTIPYVLPNDTIKPSEGWAFALLHGHQLILSFNNAIYSLSLNYPYTRIKLHNYPDVRFMMRYRDWIVGTSYGHGLFVISGDSLYKLPINRFQHLQKAHSIQLTKDGHLFISTNNGLFNTTITEIQNYLSGASKEVYYQYYDNTEGIDNSEFNGACYPSSLALGNGYLTFANMGGLVWFKPSALVKNENLSKRLYINKLEIDRRFVPTSDSVVLPSKTENFSIHYSFVYWQNPANIKMEYMLDGFTKHWNPMPPLGQELSFTNLPAGKYTLVIRSQIGFEQSDITYTTLYIYKEPQYYETTWFMILAICGFVFALVGLSFLYNKRLRKQNIVLEERVAERTESLEITNRNLRKSEQELIQSVNVKNKLISIISHDIVTPLKFISLVSRNYKLEEQKDLPSEHEVIREIHHTSQRLFDNAQNILNWVRYQNNLISVNKTPISPYAIIDELCDLFKDLAALRKNSIVNAVDMDDIIKTDKTILVILIQNILSNAVKYTHSSSITITSDSLESKYRIHIADSGQGISKNNMMRIHAIRNKVKTNIFDDSADGTGLGYIIIFELAELLNADINIESDSNGTCVSIIL